MIKFLNQTIDDRYCGTSMMAKSSYEVEEFPHKRCNCCKIIFLTILVFLSILGIFIAILSINAYLLTSGFERHILDSNPLYLNLTKEDIHQQAKRLAGGIKIRTVSTRDVDKKQKYLEAIEELHKYIYSQYPNIESANFIRKIIVSNYSVIYRVQGTSSSKNVYMLCGHLDVAPTPRITKWEYYPFSGNIAPRHQCSYCDRCDDMGEDFVHGRGAIDTKNVVFGILETVENLLKRNIRPARTFYIAFGHDEEIGGLEGSAKIKIEMKNMLKRHNESVDFILDEGTVVIKNYFSFIKEPLIFISVTEKGDNKIKLDMSSTPFNSHMDDKTTMRKERCERKNTLRHYQEKIYQVKHPFRYGDGPEYDMWRYLSLYMNHFVYKLLASNMWVTKRLISGGLINPAQVPIYCLRMNLLFNIIHGTFVS